MKKIFKKNQIIIATLAVMIAVAGYLNYSGKLFGDTDSGTTEANADLANQAPRYLAGRSGDGDRGYREQ